MGALSSLEEAPEMPPVQLRGWEPGFGQRVGLPSVQRVSACQCFCEHKDLLSFPTKSVFL